MRYEIKYKRDKLFVREETKEIHWMVVWLGFMTYQPL